MAGDDAIGLQDEQLARDVDARYHTSGGRTDTAGRGDMTLVKMSHLVGSEVVNRECGGTQRGHEAHQGLQSRRSR